MSRRDDRDGSLGVLELTFFIPFPLVRGRPPGADDPDDVVLQLDEHGQENALATRLANLEGPFGMAASNGSQANGRSSAARRHGWCERPSVRSTLCHASPGALAEAHPGSLVCCFSPEPPAPRSSTPATRAGRPPTFLDATHVRKAVQSRGLRDVSDSLRAPADRMALPPLVRGRRPSLDLPPLELGPESPGTPVHPRADLRQREGPDPAQEADLD